MSSSKLILLEIFSYSCMNCLRSLEFIKKIDKKYRKFGLGTIIIHPPEWEFEKESNNIAYALKKHNIRFPVIIDKNKKIIKRYGIDFWPTQILIMGGKILYKHVGEGNYKALEKKIIRFLQIKAKEIFNKEPVYSKFPTLYAGKRKHGKIADFKKSLKFGIVYKDGTWLQKEEFIQSVGNNNSLIIMNESDGILSFTPMNIGLYETKVCVEDKYKTVDCGNIKFMVENE